MPGVLRALLVFPVSWPRMAHEVRVDGCGGKALTRRCDAFDGPALSSGPFAGGPTWMPRRSASQPQRFLATRLHPHAPTECPHGVHSQIWTCHGVRNPTEDSRRPTRSYS